jgi:choline dehydrogenase-like flavoprotein
MQEFDYIVVGAGSAGCTVATRLVQAGHAVLLLEAGARDNHPYIHIPATFFKVHGTHRTWRYETVSQSHVNGRQMYIPQGRTLGGGSSVNGMIYIRGQAQDYEDWKAAGCVGWGWEDVLPAFKRSEGNQRIRSALHGNDGPLIVSDNSHCHPLSRAFVDSAVAYGLPRTEDFNGPTQAGAGFYQTTTFNGRRGSSAATYLKSVLHNPLLTVIPHALVERVLIEGGRAVGIRARIGGQPACDFRCAREVVLTAGAVATPKILMLSGIGQADQLTRHGIKVVVDASEVGENFQDHLTSSVYGRTREPASLLGQDKGISALGHGLKYLAGRKGLLSSNVIESGAFFDSAGGDGRPDVQIHMTPTLVGDVDRLPPEGHGISINPCALRPKSRGTARLRSANPEDQLLLDAGFLSHPDDLATMIRGVRISLEILRSGPLAKLIESPILLPDRREYSDQELADHIRRVCKTVFHPSGTCRMGSDGKSVVDNQLRVRGIVGLRVADASIMPRLISGNTNAPCIMIGERCAEFMLASQGDVRDTMADLGQDQSYRQRILSSVR